MAATGTINPGGVLTDLLKFALNCGDEITEKTTLLSGKDIADTVICVLGASPGAEVFELTIIPQKIIVGAPVPQLEN